MKKILLLIGIFVLGCKTQKQPESNQEGFNPIGKYVYGFQTLTIKDSPGGKKKCLAASAVKVIEVADSLYKVDYGNCIGYIRKDAVSFNREEVIAYQKANFREYHIGDIIFTNTSTKLLDSPSEKGNSQCSIGSYATVEVVETPPGDYFKIQAGDCSGYIHKAFLSRSNPNSSDNKLIQTGPRGGRYYINKNGNKTYIKN